MTTRDPIRTVVDDLATNRALEDLRRVTQELRRALPTVIKSVTLANGTRTVIRHGLAKKYTSVYCSPVRGASSAGYIEEEEPTDRSREIWLTATDFGAAVTVDLLVMT